MTIYTGVYFFVDTVDILLPACRGHLVYCLPQTAHGYFPTVLFGLILNGKLI